MAKRKRTKSRKARENESIASASTSTPPPSAQQASFPRIVLRVNTRNTSYPTPEPTPTLPGTNKQGSQSNSSRNMAPNPAQVLDDNLRGTIQDLFSIQSNVHGYQGPATQRALVQNVTSLQANLERIYNSAQPLASRPIPPEIIEYIEEGRNPDIYTREFVELTQKGNRYLKSKATAYAQFRDELAQRMTAAWPEMREVVERVLDGKAAGVEGLTGLESGGNIARTGEIKVEPETQQSTAVSDSTRLEPSTQTDASLRDNSFTLPGLGMAPGS